MTVVVLGWDGLDYDLVHKYGLGDAFGPVNTRLETFENPVIGKPHTYEIWPSIITGKHPSEHNVFAEAYTQGGSWESPWLNVAARVSKYTVPDALRWRVGRLIRDRGAEFSFERLDYYERCGLWTVFDDRQSFPLAIPNARSRYDDQLGVVTDRGASLAEYMDIETGPSGETIHVPNVSLRTFATRLEADLGEKLGAVRQAVAWDFDLVFVWLGYLDTVGHVAPTIEDPERWVRDGYETAAAYTSWIQQTVIDCGDTTVCVSDHGLKDGEHSMDAFYGTWADTDTVMPESVLDVADAIDTIAPRSNARSERHSASTSDRDYAVVNERLEALGYK